MAEIFEPGHAVDNANIVGSAMKGINGFWSHINIVYLLNILFNILKTRTSEQYR